MQEKPLQLIESICLQDGQIPLLSFHQKRVNHSRFMLFGIKKQLNIDTFLKEQDLPVTGCFKIRIVYGRVITDFSCLPYKPKMIKTLRVVEADDIEYRFKHEDRKALDKAFSYRDGCDDIIISHRQYITDTYFGNIALYDGRKWWTPAHPLLKGTRRAALIKDKKIQPTVIRVPDLKYFKELKIINAMLSLEESEPIPISEIFLNGEKLDVDHV